jgi:hypothetical protein
MQLDSNIEVLRAHRPEERSARFGISREVRGNADSSRRRHDDNAVNRAATSFEKVTDAFARRMISAFLNVSRSAWSAGNANIKSPRPFTRTTAILPTVAGCAVTW